MAYPFRLKSMSERLNRFGHRKIFLLAACLVAVASQHSSVAADTKGDPLKGQQIFQKNTCAMCHPGGENTMEPAHPIKGKAFQAKYSSDKVLEATIRQGFQREGMPSFSKSAINDSDMADLIAYVRSLSKATSK
jgi:mono/diheme cytochrome c family protein